MDKAQKKLLAMSLVVFMLVTLMPIGVFAAPVYNADATTDTYYKVISQKNWELAPGVEETEIVLNNSEGSKRQVVHTVKVDMNNPYTKVIPGYKGMIPTPGNYGTESTSTQAKNAEKLGYGNVVAATNAMLSWYNNAYYLANPHLIGEPLGYSILDGYYYENSQGQASGANTTLVINYDVHPETGETRPADMPKVVLRDIKEPLTGWEQNAISTWGWLVKPDANGVPVNQYQSQASSGHTTGHESRTFVGVTANGEIIISVSDGRQAPYSTGFSSYEMADYMIKMGCIYAANCDGGGSTTFVSERPGEELKVNCSLSDGGERPTTNTLLVVSTAPASGVFERASLSTEYDYYTPGSTIEFTALGTDAIGTEVAVPSDVEWVLKEEGMGTIEDGVFVSNGTEGTVTAQVLHNGKVVGERTITLALPDALSFSQPVVTIPNGERAQIPVKATLEGLYEIGISAEDVTITSDNDAVGTVDGLHFIGAALTPDNNSSNVTVTLNANEAITASATFKLGEASVVMWDFEDGQADIDEWNCIVLRNPGEAHRDFYHELSLATAEDGKVHDGQYSMRLKTNGLSSKDVHSQQYAYVRLGLKDQKISLENARSLGFWMYVPEDNIQCWVQGFYKYDSNGDGTPDTLAEVNLMNSENVYYNVDESGWHYLSMDLSDFEKIDLTYSSPFDADPADGPKTGDTDEFFLVLIFHKAINNILWQTNGSINGPFTYYIDNITVDYSEVVDDREAPFIENITLDNNGIKTGLKKREVATTDNNVLAVSAKVTEATYRTDGTGTKHSLTNYTGLDIQSAKAYVDGVEVDCVCADGHMSIEGIAVADGYHRVKFEISDNAGNKASVVRVIKVESGVKASTIKVVPRDASLDRLPFGSIYWMNVEATNIETIDMVEMEIDLNSVNHWQLDNMIVADGFTAACSMDEETNTAFIRFARVGNGYQGGNAVLAQIPIRMVSFDADMNVPGLTAATYFTGYQFWPQDLKVDVDMGKITYVDGYTSNVMGVFSNEEFHVDSELYTDYQSIDKTYLATHGTTHVHTAVALDDVAAGCQDGYTGRTFCEVCNSVVDWGTTVAGNGGHDYQVIDGVLTCSGCDDIFNGIFSDGKTYIDGIVVADGWTEIDGNTYYYLDGVKLTGSKYVEGRIHTFDENGVYLPDFIFDGFYEIDGHVMYFVANEYITGLQRIGNDYHYFDENGLSYEGEYTILGETCLFEDGKYVTCTSTELLDAGWVGREVEYVVYPGGILTLGGKGTTFEFKNHGNRPFVGCLEIIKKIVVGKDVTLLNLNLFSYLIATEIEFEEGSKLKNISTGVFHAAPYIKEMNIPSSVTTIGAIAFKKATGLRRLNIPASVKSIAETAFKNCSENLVLYVQPGSYAESFAIAHNMKYTTDSYIRNGFVEENGEIYYYENDVKYTKRGMFQVGDDFYYAKADGALVRNATIWASVTNDLLPFGQYTFDENGVIQLKRGFIEENGEIYYYINGAKYTTRGMFEVDGEIYYAKNDGALVRNTSIWATVTNDILPFAKYTFDEVGRIQIKKGFVEENGEIYYYIKGVKYTTRGMFEVDGEIYYAKADGALVRNTSIWTTVTNDLLPFAKYTFDEAGRILLKKGFVEENGELYYYVKGVKHTTRGVFKVGNDYYYAKNGGALVRNTSIWATVTNDLVPFAKYTFDENGKMIIE